jgi:hypothetical protein
MARAWSPEAISRVTGIPEHDIIHALSGRGVTPGLAAATKAAYEQLWDQSPPCVTREDREVAEAAAAHARERGWAPPMAWDDDQIDQPHGKPAAGWKPRPRGRYRSADLVEDAEWIRRHGGYRLASRTVIATRLGITKYQLEHAYREARRSGQRDSQPQAEAS